jgi:hypothetical protein
MKYKEDKQHLIHYLFHNLIDVGIISNGNEYSTKILGKNSAYYYVQKKDNYDLTFESTMNAIIAILKLIRKYEKQNPTLGYIHSEKIEVLKHCETKLREYLRVRFRVAEIVEEVSTIYDDEADFYGIVI